MTQNVLDFSQNPSGIELMDVYLAGMAENQLTNHSGTSRPSYGKSGTFWIDTSITPWTLKQFTGTNDVIVGTLDQTNLYFTARRALGDKNGNDITTKYVTVTGTAAKATADADGNTISSTYVKTTGTAAKATADADGNTISSTYAKKGSANTFSGNNTFSGINTFTGKTHLLVPRLSKQDSAKEGGQIEFESGDTEPNAGKLMHIDRYDGKFRFYGNTSSGVTRTPLQVDIQNNTVLAVTPSSATDNSTNIATTAWVKSSAFGIPDYERRVTVTSPYTPTENGILRVYQSGGSPTAWINTMQGSTELVVARAQSTDSSSGIQTVWCFAESGREYTFGKNAGTLTGTFIPFK